VPWLIWNESLVNKGRNCDRSATGTKGVNSSMTCLSQKWEFNTKQNAAGHFQGKNWWLWSNSSPDFAFAGSWYLNDTVAHFFCLSIVRTPLRRLAKRTRRRCLFWNLTLVFAKYLNFEACSKRKKKKKGDRQERKKRTLTRMIPAIMFFRTITLATILPFLNQHFNASSLHKLASSPVKESVHSGWTGFRSRRNGRYTPAIGA